MAFAQCLYLRIIRELVMSNVTENPLAPWDANIVQPWSAAEYSVQYHYNDQTYGSCYIIKVNKTKCKRHWTNTVLKENFTSNVTLRFNYFQNFHTIVCHKVQCIQVCSRNYRTDFFQILVEMYILKHWNKIKIKHQKYLIIIIHTTVLTADLYTHVKVIN